MDDCWIVHTAQSLIAGVGRSLRGDDIAHDAQARNTTRNHALTINRTSTLCIGYIPLLLLLLLLYYGGGVRCNFQRPIRIRVGTM